MPTAPQTTLENSIERLFIELKPRIDAAGEIAHELNRHLAYRFNVMDYLRTDELGLSRIIADLLNPRASHGQGPLFLRLLLDQLNSSLSSWPDDLRLQDAIVETEAQANKQRRIDILVQLKHHPNEGYCLAIENKPFAGDSCRQVLDYLEYLKGKYDNPEIPRTKQIVVKSMSYRQG